MMGAFFAGVLVGAVALLLALTLAGGDEKGGE